MMNIRKLEKFLLKELHGFSIHDGYFYSNNFQHILCGYKLERTPNGLYLWRFVYPLFDSARAIHLTFGDRVLDGSECLLNGLSESEVVSRLMDFIRMDEFFLNKSSPMSINDFASRCHSNPSIMRNTHVYLVYLMSLLLLDRVDEVLCGLNVDENALSKKDLLFYKKWIELMGKNIPLAKELVLNNEADFLNLCRLSS